MGVGGSGVAVGVGGCGVGVGVGGKEPPSVGVGVGGSGVAVGVGVGGTGVGVAPGVGVAVTTRLSSSALLNAVIALMSLPPRSRTPSVGPSPSARISNVPSKKADFWNVTVPS